MVIVKTLLHWFCNLGVIGKCIVILELINVLSFVGVRAFLRFTGNLTAPITVLKEAAPSDDGTTLTIAIGGSMGTGKCFNIFLPYCGEGRAVYLDHSGLGYSERSQYRQIKELAAESGAKNIVFLTLGPGDAYAQRFECEFDGIDGYTVRTRPVNPETSCKVMNAPSRWGSFAGAWLAKGVFLGFGWLNVIEWCPKTDEKFSTAYMTDQFVWLATVNAGPHKEGCVKDVILSTADQFFRNRANSSASGKHLEEYYFPGLSKENFHYIDADCCNTIDMGYVYEKALEEIYP